MHHRLGAGRKVNDRQTPMGKTHQRAPIASPVQEKTLTIRPAMADAVSHGAEPGFGVRHTARQDEAGYAAHVIALAEFGKTLDERRRQ